jgi:tetratricopeptide (TPR) repeat protein
VQAALLLRRDDVVGGSGDGPEIADPRRVEEEPVEGRDAGHGVCIEHPTMDARRSNESTYDLLVKGLHFLETGHPHQAVIALQKAKLAEPEKGSIREALGRALYMTGRWPRARLEFAKAVAIDPVNHYAHFALGLTCARTGERTRAIAHLKLAVAMSPREEYQQALERLTG